MMLEKTSSVGLFCGETYASSLPEHFIVLIPGAINRYNFLEASLFLKIELEVLLTVELEAVLCVELQSIYTSQL